MSQNIKKVFEKQGFVRLKGVLNFKEDLEPVLNDMAFIMNRLVHRFVSKKNKAKVLNYGFMYDFSKSLCLRESYFISGAESRPVLKTAQWLLKYPKF